MAGKTHKSFNINESDKKSPFIIPEGYLDNLPDNVMQKIKEGRNGNSSRVRKIIRIVRPQLAFAAGFIAFVLVIYSVVSFILGKEKTVLAKENNYAELIEYASYQLDENILCEYLEGNKDSNEISPNDDMSDLIIDYLVREKIDYGSLLKEL